MPPAQKTASKPLPCPHCGRSTILFSVSAYMRQDGTENVMYTSVCFDSCHSSVTNYTLRGHRKDWEEGSITNFKCQTCGTIGAFKVSVVDGRLVSYCDYEPLFPKNVTLEYFHGADVPEQKRILLWEEDEYEFGI